MDRYTAFIATGHEAMSIPAGTGPPETSPWLQPRKSVGVGQVQQDWAAGYEAEGETGGPTESGNGDNVVAGGVEYPTEHFRNVFSGEKPLSWYLYPGILSGVTGSTVRTFSGVNSKDQRSTKSTGKLVLLLASNVSFAGSPLKPPL
jgi:hypothetical protein